MKKTVQEQAYDNAKVKLEKHKQSIMSKLLKVLNKWQVENIDNYLQIKVEVGIEKEDKRLHATIEISGVKSESFENTEYFYIWIYPDGKVLGDANEGLLFPKISGQMHKSIFDFLVKNKASYDDINRETKRLFSGILFLTF